MRRNFKVDVTVFNQRKIYLSRYL